MPAGSDYIEKAVIIFFFFFFFFDDDNEKDEILSELKSSYKILAEQCRANIDIIENFGNIKEGADSDELSKYLCEVNNALSVISPQNNRGKKLCAVQLEKDTKF